MNFTKYISIKSVLYDIALTLPDEMWEENKFMEWATKALAKLKFEDKFQQNVGLITIEEHKGTLMPEARHVVQAAYKVTTDPTDLIETMRKIMGINDVPTELGTNLRLPAAGVFASRSYLRTSGWLPIKLSTNSFIKSIPEIEGLSFINMNCNECAHEMHIDPNGCITTTIPNGHILISYLSYPVDKDGNAMLPDNEDLKEALMHYVYYRLYLAKSFMHEQNSIQEREYHLSRFQLLGTKAVGDLNMPDSTTMEQIKNNRNRIVPRTEQFNSFYSKLNNSDLQSFI